MSKRSVKQWLLASAVLAAVCSPVLDARAAEADPQIIAHEGRMYDAAGKPLSGFHSVTFSLYAAKVGGAPVWTETTEVEFDEGYFDVWLGEATPLDDSLLDGKTRYLAIARGGAPGSTRRVAVASQTHPNFVRPGAAKPAPPAEPQPEPEPPAAAPAPNETPQRPTGVVLSIGAAESPLAPLADGRGLAFIGDTVGMSIAANQLAFVSASAGLGSTAPGGARDLQLAVCTRKIGDRAMLDDRATRRDDLAAAENSRQTYTLHARLAGLAPGDYEVGLCGHVKADAGRWNHNDRSHVSVIVTAG